MLSRSFEANFQTLVDLADDEDRYLSGLRETRWSDSRCKRAFDFFCALVGLITASPIMLAAAIAVKLSSPGAVLFRQRRMGRAHREFVIYKFRTMRMSTDSNAGPSVTCANDNRLTRAGALLRRFKIDELPQLLNVLKGDMSLVGSRPKVPHHQIYELKYRPGITGAASLAFRDEERMLRNITHQDLDEYQVRVLMPLKTHLDANYMDHATFLSDLKILLATVLGRGERLHHGHLQRLQVSLLALDTAVSARFVRRPSHPPEECIEAKAAC